MKKLKLLLLLAAFASMSLSSNVSALEDKPINSAQDYFDAIAAINSSAETEFTISLGSDIVLTAFPSTGDPITITNGKTVTILGNGHKIKISDTGSYGYHSILTVGNATVNLGNASGNALYIEGGGPSVSTSESLINVGGTLNMYAGVDIGNNHSGQGSMVGGAFRFRQNGTVNMYGGRIHDNSSTGACYGGAVMMDTPYNTFNMYGGIFENNSTCTNYGSYGGAIFLLDSDTMTGVINIEGGTFRNNSSNFGGAIANMFGTMTIKNAIFQNNSAIGGEQEEDPAGGAILQYSNSQSTIESSVFTGNSATSGGAIYDFGVRLDIYNSTLSNNTATNDGGAVLVGSYGTFVSSENTYENNSATNGGAINNTRTLYSIDDVITENNSSIGGGIYSTGTRNTINSEVFNNKATTAANDVFLSSTANNITLKDASTFTGTSTFNGVSLGIDGWYKDEENNRYSRVNITDKVSSDSVTTGNNYYLTAANSTKHVIVSFAGDEISEAEQYVEQGKKLASLPSPVREHYSFAGWYSDSDLSNKFSLDNTINDNTTLYAKWVKEKHTITIDPAGGSYEGVAGNTTMEKSYGDNYSLKTPTKYGYRFVGWTVTSAEAYDPETSTITVGSSDVTVVAIWEEIPEDEIVVPSTSGDEEEDKKDDKKDKDSSKSDKSSEKNSDTDTIVVPNTASDDSTASTIPTIIAVSIIVCFIAGLIFFKSKDKKIKL